VHYVAHQVEILPHAMSSPFPDRVACVVYPVGRARAADVLVAGAER